MASGCSMSNRMAPYMEAAANEQLFELLVHTLARDVRRFSPVLHGHLEDLRDRAAGRAIPSSASSYADRDYDRSGSIVFARQVARPKPEEVAAKCVRLGGSRQDRRWRGYRDRVQSRSAFIRIRPGHWTWGKPSAPG